MPKEILYKKEYYIERKMQKYILHRKKYYIERNSILKGKKKYYIVRNIILSEKYFFVASRPCMQTNYRRLFELFCWHLNENFFSMYKAHLRLCQNWLCTQCHTRAWSNPSAPVRWPEKCPGSTGGYTNTHPRENRYSYWHLNVESMSGDA